MARIPTYQEQFVSKGGTQKISISDPVGQALGNLGGTVKQAGQVVNQYFQQREDLKNKADIARVQSEYIRQKAARTTELNTQVGQKNLSFMDAKGLFPEFQNEFKTSMIDEADIAQETRDYLNNWFAVKSAEDNVISDTYWDSKKAESDIYTVFKAGDDAMSQAFAYRLSGDDALADEYELQANQYFDSLRGQVGDEQIDKRKNVSRYNSYQAMISMSVNEQDVDIVQKRFSSDKNIGSEQLQDLTVRAESQKSAIASKRLTEERRLRVEMRTNADDAQARTKATFDRPMNIQELYDGRDQGLWTDTEVAHGIIEWGKYSETAFNEAQKVRGQQLKNDVANGVVGSFGDVWKLYASGEISLEDARFADNQVRKKIESEYDFNDKKYNSFYGRLDKIRSLKSIDDYNSVIDSIDNDNTLSTDEKIAQRDEVTALYSYHKDQSLSDAMQNGYIRVRNLENMIRKYEPSVRVGTITGAFFSTKNLKTIQDVDNVIKQMETIYSAGISKYIRLSSVESKTIPAFTEQTIEEGYRILESGDVFIGPDGLQRIKP